MPVAITHQPSPRLQECQLTFIERQSFDWKLVLEQHAAYESLLQASGYSVVRANVNSEYPDSVFVEDTAVALPEAILLCPMGTAERKPEPSRMRNVLAMHREVLTLPESGSLEGGDVLRMGKRLYVGVSSRTDLNTIELLRQAVGPWGYQVTPVEVTGALHLKTACCALDETRVLTNRKWLGNELPKEWEIIDTENDEPWGANLLRLGSTLAMASGSPRTIEKVQQLGFNVHVLDISELAKAEAGLTCLSILLDEITPDQS